MLDFASFSLPAALLPWGQKWWLLAALSEPGPGHRHTILFTTLHLFVLQFGVIEPLSVCSLVPVSIKKAGTNNSRVLIAAKVGLLCLLATKVPAWQTVRSLRSSVFLLFWRFYSEDSLEEKGGSSKSIPNLKVYGLC